MAVDQGLLFQELSPKSGERQPINHLVGRNSAAVDVDLKIKIKKKKKNVFLMYGNMMIRQLKVKSSSPSSK